MVDLYIEVLLQYEKKPKYKLNIKGGEPFLSKHNLYRSIGTPGNTKSDLIRNWILHYCDGTKNSKDIAKMLNIEENIVLDYINNFKNKNIIHEYIR